MAQQAAAARSQKMAKTVAPDNVPSLSQVLKHRQNESLERLASAEEAKANIAKEQYMFNFYMSNPTSAASIAWFAAKAIEYANNASNTTTMAETTVGIVDDANVVGVVGTTVNNNNDDDNDMYKDCDDGNDDDDDGSLYAPVVFARGVAVDNAIEQTMLRPPTVIVVGGTADTANTSDDSQESLPPTQRLVSAFNNAMADDSEATTMP